MCDCDNNMDAKTKYYFTKMQGLVGRMGDIPRPCGEKLIKQLEAKLVEVEPEQAEPQSDGSEGDSVAPQ